MQNLLSYLIAQDFSQMFNIVHEDRVINSLSFFLNLVEYLCLLNSSVGGMIVFTNKRSDEMPPRQIPRCILTLPTF